MDKTNFMYQNKSRYNFTVSREDVIIFFKKNIKQIYPMDMRKIPSTQWGPM